MNSFIIPYTHQIKMLSGTETIQLTAHSKLEANEKRRRSLSCTIRVYIGALFYSLFEPMK